MASPLWAPALWSPTPWPPFPAEPPEPEPTPPELEYNRWEPAVFQRADWTCAAASSAWVLNSLGDEFLGRSWGELDVVNTLREVTYPGAISPNYGLARADMYDLELMYDALGYRCARKQHIDRDDVIPIAGAQPIQINGARWYHHSGARGLGPNVLLLANPAPTWRGVGQELSPDEAAVWGQWNMLTIVGKL